MKKLSSLLASLTSALRLSIVRYAHAAYAKGQIEASTLTKIEDTLFENIIEVACDNSEDIDVNGHHAVYFPALKHTVILANPEREYDEYGVTWVADYQDEAGEPLSEYLYDLYEEVLSEILNEYEDHF